MLILKKILLFVALFLSLASVGFSQEEDTTKIYTSLEEALKSPDDVIRLSLKRKRLKEIPQTVYKFPNLTYLDLSKNQMEEIGVDIAKLTKLEYLNISNNNLSRLPNELTKLTSLKKLIANQNNLTALPEKLGECDKLQYIDLWSNNIEDLPESLSKCADLKVIDMRVIMTTDDRQREMQQKIPQAKILFSPGCNCGR